jgi:hypothetical protein
MVVFFWFFDKLMGVAARSVQRMSQQIQGFEPFNRTTMLVRTARSYIGRVFLMKPGMERTRSMSSEALDRVVEMACYCWSTPCTPDMKVTFRQEAWHLWGIRERHRIGVADQFGPFLDTPIFHNAPALIGAGGLTPGWDD